MNHLLAEVIDAHGGMDRWKAYKTVEASIVSRGGLFALKGLIQDPDPRRMTVWPHGISLPTRRRAYTRGPDRRPILDMLMVAIDFSGVKFS